jgi:hypothetical protein
VPRDLDAVVRCATRNDPSERYPDASAMATALRQLVSSDPFELARSLVRTESGGDVVPAAAPRERPSPGPEQRDAPARGGMDWRWVVVALVVLAATGVLTALATTGDDTPNGGPSTVADAGVPVTRVAVFDPYGSVAEGQTSPLAAVDDDPETVWRTPTYPVPLRSLGTPGLGVWIDVGTPRAIDAVEVDLATGGITIELLAADSAPGPGTTEADWRSLDRRVRPGDRAVLTADGETARYWLVWITELEPDGEAWQAAVTDLRFRPATTGTP